jgi:hypothetical protein
MKDKIDRLLKRAGVKRVNTPKFTPKHPTKKAVVVAKVGSKVKLIRFGAQGMGHNYSPEARRRFKSAHAKNIKKGKMSAAYWSNRFLWAGPRGHKQNPPMSQKQVFGKIVGRRPNR